MNLLITGINGFVGRALAALLNEEYNISGLARRKSLINGIQVYSSEELDYLDLEIDVVIMCHAAISSGAVSLSIEELFKVNVHLTQRLVHKFENAFFIYISTVSVYEPNNNFILEHSRVNPQSDYALSKLWAEKIVSQTKRHSILRLSSVYGIGMVENTIIPNYISQALTKKSIQVWGNGERVQNYVHIDDVVKYIMLIIKNRQSVMNKLLLGVAKSHYSNLELAKIICAYTNADIEFVNEDKSYSFKYNNDFTLNELNWAPKRKLHTVIQQYIAWKKR